MKKSIYALCGTALVILATLFRIQWGGGPDIAGMIILGVLLLIGSADLPSNTRKVAR